VVFIALVLGCAGTGDPDRADPAPGQDRGEIPRPRLVTEIAPGQVANRPPRFLSLAPLTAREGETYRYGVDAMDPDGDEVSYRLVRAPEGAILEGHVLKWTPGHGQVGHRQRFTLKAMDEHGAVQTQSWSLIPRAEASHGALPGQHR
jgi:hypothetical protein